MKKTHKGSCHCGAVQFEFDAADDAVAGGIACNCSMCGRSGTILSFIPMGDFRLVAGEDQLTSYKFNKHTIDHVFCRNCGIKSFAKGKTKDGSEMRAINLRCVEDVDVAQLRIQHYNGKDA